MPRTLAAARWQVRKLAACSYWPGAKPGPRAGPHIPLGIPVLAKGSLLWQQIQDAYRIVWAAGRKLAGEIKPLDKTLGAWFHAVVVSFTIPAAMEILIGVAKTNKYAMSESGDTLEVVERPSGGLSVVLADGQRSGKSAKFISTMVVRKVISLLAEGVRDGAAARAASDYLLTHRNGQVQSTLNIISIEMETRKLLVTRNNPLPVLVFQDGEITSLDERSDAVGLRRETRPVLTALEIRAGLSVAVFTDGLPFAGERSGTPMDIHSAFNRMATLGESPQAIADGLMSEALALEHNRPGDDISILVVGVRSTLQDDAVRRMQVRLPVWPG